MAINLKFMRINVETLERRLAKGLDPAIYTSGKESVWEGITGLHGKVDSMKRMSRADVMAEMISMMAPIKIEATSGTDALVQCEVALATRQLRSRLLDVRREHSVNVSSLEA
jgi:hypothetical protein